MFQSPIIFFLVIAGVTIVGVVEPLFVQLVFFFFSVVFPKLPVLQIEGYLVPIRTEDLFLALAFFVLMLRWLFYGEKAFHHPLFKWMLLYSGATFLSFLFALLVLGSVPDGKIGFLYWLRGPEYFAASFLCLWGIRSWKQFGKIMLGFVIFTALIGTYGILQEFAVVPAFDAMHTTDEIVLIRFIPSFGEDRLFSTFGGPYDLAAFYLLAIPICVALIPAVSSLLHKFFLLSVLSLSFLCFYLTYARTPLPALAVALYLCLVFLGKPRLGAALALICAVPAFLFAGFESRLQGAMSDLLAEGALGGRLRTSWADAFDALFRSPLTGTGPASVGNLMGVDGLYLLLLGTWGILGLVCFLALAYQTLKYQKQVIASSQQKLQRALAIGMYAGTIGLLVNGITIDTFFSSKVAFPYWFLMGLMFASCQLAAEPVPKTGAVFAHNRLEPRLQAGGVTGGLD